jgi:hypothetical protein
MGIFVKNLKNEQNSVGECKFHMVLTLSLSLKIEHDDLLAMCYWFG